LEKLAMGYFKFLRNEKYKEGKMKKTLVAFVCLLVISIIFVGCSSGTPANTSPAAAKPTTSNPISAPSSPTPKFGGTLKLIYDAPPSGTIGYPQGMIGDATTACQLVIEPLLKQISTGEYIPWLTESYKLADDRTSITFNLRKGVKFHDGSDFNAQVAKWNLDNTIAAKQQPNWTSVEAIDDYTVKINFSKWQNTMMSGFNGATAWMVSKSAFDKNGLDWVKQNPVGTGPFKFVSYKKDTSFDVVKNPNYWKKDAQGKQLPYLDAVTMLFISDTVTQESTMQAGEADMLTVKPGKVAADMAASGFTVKSAQIDTSCLIPDTINADSPWSKQAVREAAEYSIDREAIAKGMGYGYWKPAYQIPGSADLTYDPNFPLARKYDTAKAKQLLADAGYPNGFKTTIIACPFNLNKDVTVALQGYFSKIGIQADIQYPDAGKFTTDYMQNKWTNGVVYEPVAGYPNYMQIFTFLFNPVTNYHPSWQRTPEELAAYNAALNAPDADLKLMRAFTDVLTKYALLVPVNEGGRGWAYKPYVMDIGALETNLPPYLKFEQAWLNK